MARPEPPALRMPSGGYGAVLLDVTRVCCRLGPGRRAPPRAEAPQLNGKRGIIVKVNPKDSGRWDVELRLENGRPRRRPVVPAPGTRSFGMGPGFVRMGLSARHSSEHKTAPSK